MTPETLTPETDLEEANQTQRFGGYMVKASFARKLERERDAARAEIEAMTALADRLAESLEASDECLALIEDVGHGANMNNVSVARGYVQEALAAYEANKKGNTP